MERLHHIHSTLYRNIVHLFLLNLLSLLDYFSGAKPIVNVQRVNFGAGKHRNHEREQTCGDSTSVDLTLGTETLLTEKSSELICFPLNLTTG